MTFGKRRNQVAEDIEEEASTEEEETAKLKINLGELLGGAKDKDPRIIGLFGSVEEEKAGELCYHLITMSEPQVPDIDEDGNVVKEAVAEIERKGVKEQQMMWMAIKTLQEAQTRIETLETKVAALEAA